ncbi:LLM class flavin-dependent oxidoreductase [Streptomyces sp. NPDC005480]|uniref:LLM class flavin-dependent oxidoreductase n=2 Tax=unclassified Streptomyces TaxID=2593676 RepID=UPI00339ECB34
MEFGVIVQGYAPAFKADGPRFEHDVLIADVERVKAADQYGFKYAWATEHHFLEEYSHLSANGEFLAFCAAQTSRLHLGSAIFNPLAQVNHPVKVAERVTMMDHLTQGRFEFGTGRGAGSHEILGFIPGMEDLNGTKKIWEETIGEFPKMFLQEEYEGFEGTYWSVPPRKIFPRPLGKGHPAMWYAAGNPPSYEMAARKGLGVLGFSVGKLADLDPVIKAYKKAIVNAEPIGAFVNDNVLCVTGVFVHEDARKAREKALNARLAYMTSNAFRYHDSFPHPEGVPVWPELIPDHDLDAIEALIESGGLICGTPDEVVQQCKRWESAGLDQLSFSLGMASLEEDKETLRLLGEHVVPQLDTDPLHRTTRFRRQAA